MTTLSKNFNEAHVQWITLLSNQGYEQKYIHMIKKYDKREKKESVSQTLGNPVALLLANRV